MNKSARNSALIGRGSNDWILERGREIAREEVEYREREGTCASGSGSNSSRVELQGGPRTIERMLATFLPR